MTIVRIIKEKLRLDACAEGDRLSVPYSPGASWKSIGMITLVKVKPLPKAGMVQIKFKSRWGTNPKVQKADIPGATMVEREREATEADGPDAGTPMRAVAVRDGITYQVVRPGDDAEKLVDEAAARSRTRPMPYNPLDELVDMPGGAMMAQVLASAASMAGVDLRRVPISYPTPESFAAVGEILAAAGARSIGPSTRAPGGSALGLPKPAEGTLGEVFERMLEDRSDGIWPGN